MIRDLTYREKKNITRHVNMLNSSISEEGPYCSSHMTMLMPKTSRQFFPHFSVKR